MWALRAAQWRKCRGLKSFGSLCRNSYTLFFILYKVKFYLWQIETVLKYNKVSGYNDQRCR